MVPKIADRILSTLFGVEWRREVKNKSLDYLEALSKVRIIRERSKMGTILVKGEKVGLFVSIFPIFENQTCSLTLDLQFLLLKILSLSNKETN